MAEEEPRRLRQVARTHNSLLILAWDENGGSDPATGTPIPWVVVGANVKAGNYGEAINHYNWLRTIENMYGLGTCTANDAGATPVTDAFSTALTWTGSSSGNWNTTENNWKNVGLSALYFNGGQVTFDSSGTNTTIAIQSAGVSPASVTFSNSTAKSYTLGGGPIAGSGGLTVSGGGQVTLTGSNTFGGTTLVTSGSLVLGNAGALCGSTLDTSGAGTLSFGALTAATLGGLTGSGKLALINSSSAPVVLSVGNNGADNNLLRRAQRHRPPDEDRHGRVDAHRPQHLQRRHVGRRGALVAQTASAIPARSLLSIGRGSSIDPGSSRCLGTAWGAVWWHRPVGLTALGRRHGSGDPSRGQRRRRGARARHYRPALRRRGCPDSLRVAEAEPRLTRRPSAKTASGGQTPIEAAGPAGQNSKSGPFCQPGGVRAGDPRSSVCHP